MLDNLLKKNPIMGVIIYPLTGLGAIWLGHYYSQSLSLLEKRAVSSRLIVLFTLFIN